MTSGEAIPRNLEFKLPIYVFLTWDGADDDRNWNSRYCPAFPRRSDSVRNAPAGHQP